jgi:LPS-assembly protein
VAGETLQPFSAPVSFTSKQQFDSSDYALTRFDGIVSTNWGGFTGSIDYGRYAAQPLLGYLHEREGVLTNAKYKMSNGVTLEGGVVLDLSRYLYDTPGQTTSKFYPSNYNLGVSYINIDGANCTTFRVAYSSVMTDPVSATPGVPLAPAVRDQTVLFELTFRTLGDIRGSTGVE